MRVLLALLVCFTAVYADTVEVDSGDVLHGEVEKLANGKLFLDTDYAGTIEIDWDKVVAVESDARYQLETEPGRRLRGELSMQSGVVVVNTEDVEQKAPATLVEEIVRLEDDRLPGFWETLNGSVGVGYTFTRGNSDQTQGSLTARARYRRDKYSAQGDLSSIFAALDDSERQSRHALQTRYDRFLTPKMFAFGLGALERNDRQRLDLRSRAGGGFGWKVANGGGRRFDVLGGFTYTNEQFRAAEGHALPRRSTGEGLVGFEWHSSQLWGVELSTRLTAHPNLVQQGRYRVEYDSGASVPLVGNFKWDVSLFDRYDSAPPRDDLQRNDYGMVSTLGFAF